ncbi:MAG TPA: HK97 family phage prohead protease, partial [Verrucomicrobiae bacterium]|nr:HK97 family phage prohead protease [Verrucomicrobiae bacterium]
MHQAWSVLNLKSLDESTRTLSGIASTPGLDRQGDSMAPEGAQFSLPMPLLWQHDATQPIGHITHATVTAAGIRVEAQMAPAGTAEFIDQAWKLIKAGLVRGLSIG